MYACEVTHQASYAYTNKCWWVKFRMFYLHSQHMAPALKRPLKWSSEFTPEPLHCEQATAPNGWKKTEIIHSYALAMHYGFFLSQHFQIKVYGQ